MGERVWVETVDRLGLVVPHNQSNSQLASPCTHLFWHVHPNISCIAMLNCNYPSKAFIMNENDYRMSGNQGRLQKGRRRWTYDTQQDG